MLLECLHIDFNYPQTQTPVLRDLCLDLKEPGFHALFGPSGVGKTSLAKLLAGTVGPSSGRIRTEGVDTILYSHNQERVPGWSNVGRHLERITPSRQAALKDELLGKFGLESHLNQRFNQLSLGQQNRINLVRYLVQDFQVLIMDESLANVDEKTRGEILFTIKETFPEVIFLYISHNVAEVARYCRRIWVLRDALKFPQAVQISGQDLSALQEVDLGALQQTMLELIHVA